MRPTRRHRALASASAATVTTLLPGAEFSTRAAIPTAGASLDAGATVALATGLQPGSSTTSMTFCMAIAVRDMVTPPRRCGRRRPAARRPCAAGMWADWRSVRQANFAVLDAPSRLHLAYRPGVPLIADVIAG